RIARAAFGGADGIQRGDAGALPARRRELDVLRREALDDREPEHGRRRRVVRAPRARARKRARARRIAERGGDMSFLRAEAALPDPAAARRAFDRAAATFARASVVLVEARYRPLERRAFASWATLHYVDYGKFPIVGDYL